MLLSVFLSANSLSQFTLNYQSFGAQSDLKTNITYDLLLDKDGLLWIASENGVWKYNGINFTAVELKEVGVFDGSYFKEDASGRIWVMEFQKSLCYVSEDKSELIRFDIPGFNFSGILGYHKFEDHLYVIKPNSLWHIHLKTQEVRELKLIDRSRVNYATISENGILVAELPDEQRSYIIDLDSEHPTMLEELPGRSFHGNRVGDKVFQSDHRKPENLVSGIKETEDISLEEFNLRPFSRIVGLKKIGDDLYAITSDGLVNIKQKKVFFRGMFCTELVKDKNGVLWVSTLSNGLLKVTDLNNFAIDLRSLSEDEIISDQLFYDENGYVFTSEEGTVYWSDGKKGFQAFRRDGPSSSIKSIVSVPELNGLIFAGRWRYYRNHSNNELQVINVGGNTTLQYTNKSLVSYGRTSLSIYSDPSYYFIPNRNQEKPSQIPFGPYFTLKTAKNKEYCHIEFDQKFIPYSSHVHNDTMVVLVDSVLYSFRVSEPELLTKRIVDRPSPIIGDDKHYYLLNKDEIVKYDHQLNKQGAIRLKSAKKIVEFKLQDDYLIVVHQRLIELIHLKTGERFVATQENGIMSNDFSNAFVYENKLLVNGSGFISIIDIPSLRDIGTPTLKFSSRGIPNAFYPYDHDGISISFAPISLKASGHVVYRIKGSFDTWKQLPRGVNGISNLDLPSGTYTIEAYFLNDLGGKSKTVSRTFTIDLPYYYKWWFLLIMALVLIGLISWYYLRRIKRIRYLKAIEQEITEIRLNSLKSQMNPHFIFNALNSIQQLVVFRKNDDAFKYILEFSQLLREVLHYSDEDFIPFDKEIQIVQAYLAIEKMRFEEDFSYTIDCANVPMESKIPTMLIQPLVENSIKHGLLNRLGKKELSIKFEYHGSYLLCRIQDNGIGFEASQKLQEHRKKMRSSLTYKNTQERLELLSKHKYHDLNIHHQDLHNDDGECTGAIVTISIPLL